MFMSYLTILHLRDSDVNSYIFDVVKISQHISLVSKQLMVPGLKVEKNVIKSLLDILFLSFLLVANVLFQLLKADY